MNLMRSEKQCVKLYHITKQNMRIDMLHKRLLFLIKSHLILGKIDFYDYKVLNLENYHRKVSIKKFCHYKSNLFLELSL
jgi:hypothetical protein